MHHCHSFGSRTGLTSNDEDEDESAEEDGEDVEGDKEEDELKDDTEGAGIRAGGGAEWVHKGLCCLFTVRLKANFGTAFPASFRGPRIAEEGSGQRECCEREGTGGEHPAFKGGVWACSLKQAFSTRCG